MKKLLIIAALLAAATLAFAGGGQGESAAGAGEFQMNAPGQYPVVKGNTPFEFRAMAVYNPMESQGKLQQAQFSEYLEKLTNVRVIFEMVNSEVWAERQNLVLASGDLPDTLQDPWGMSAVALYNYGQEGTIIPLNQYVDKLAPDLLKELNTYPELKSQAYMPDGKLYALPDVEGSCFHCTMSNKMWVYKPWVDKLGLKWMPETTEEFYQMLKAFKTRDPNGNGKADEIPLMGAATGGWNTNPLIFIMNSFIYTEPGRYLNREKGKESFAANTNEWREGLKYLNRLVKEGLLAPETFVQQNQQLVAAAENPGYTLLGAAPAGWYGVFAPNASSTLRYVDYHPISPLKGPAGVRYAQYSPMALRYHTKITKAAKRPDIIVQWANWFYQDWPAHGSISGRFTQEGVHWRYATDAERNAGVVARDGRPAVTITLKEETYGKDVPDTGWTRAGISWGPYGTAGMPLEWAKDPTKQEWRLMIATRDLMQPYKPAEGFTPPNLIFDDAVRDEITDLNTNIAGGTGVVQRWSTEFIVGARDINSEAEWSAYLAELKKAGLDRYMQIWQQTITKAGY